MNKIDALFKEKKQQVISIYFPAGFPQIDDTKYNIKICINSVVDIIEIGIPFSDPLADGYVIQKAHEQALKNGMNLPLLFRQLEQCNISQTHKPILLMGYWNTIYQYGIKKFVRKCKEIDISGVIIPDLTIEEYLLHYKYLFDENNLHNIFLVSPNTSNERLKYITENAIGFIYVVSMPTTTGSKVLEKDLVKQKSYFKKVASFGFPTMIGSGVSDKEKFLTACQFANGAIIGSGFVKALRENNEEVFLKQFKV